MEYHQFKCPYCGREFSWGTLQEVLHSSVTRSNGYGHYCLLCGYDDRKRKHSKGPIENRWSEDEQRRVENEGAYALFRNDLKVMDLWIQKHKAYKATNANTLRRLDYEGWSFPDADPVCDGTGHFTPLLVTKDQALREAVRRNSLVADKLMGAAKELLQAAETVAPVLSDHVQEWIKIRQIAKWANETSHGEAAAEVLKILDKKV